VNILTKYYLAMILRIYVLTLVLALRSSRTRPGGLGGCCDAAFGVHAASVCMRSETVEEPFSASRVGKVGEDEA